jgi:hypothetical protein
MKPAKTIPPFNLIFATVLLLTLGSGGTALHLANHPHPTEAQGRILEGAMDTWKMGTLTLIGLLGIGSTNPKA